MATDIQENLEGVESEPIETGQVTADEPAAESSSPAKPAPESAQDDADEPAAAAKPKKNEKQKEKDASAETTTLDEKASDNNEYAFNAKQAKRKHAKFAQGARFVNTCTFTKPVYRAYLRGAQSRTKTVTVSVFMVAFIMMLAIGINFGMDLRMIAVSILGIVATSLVYAQPWMIAIARTDKAKQRYGTYQRNVTYFYEDGLLMNNISADAQAYAYYTDIRELKETDDFIYMFVNKACYFAILTGFKGGEEQIPEFRKFIAEKAVNAKNGLAKDDSEKKKKKSRVDQAAEEGAAQEEEAEE